MSSAAPFAPSEPVRFSWEEGGTLYVLPFDACTLETHNETSQITSHPVESGENVSDHITKDPPRITLEGVYSNTPLPKLADIFGPNSPLNVNPNQVTFGQNPLLPRRAEGLFEQLDRLRALKILVTAHTNLRDYEDMAIASVTVPRDAARGGSVFLTIELQKIRLVESQTVELSSEGKGTKKRGRKATKEANASEASKAGDAGGSILSLL